jgi:hypothetical protein
MKYLLLLCITLGCAKQQTSEIKASQVNNADYTIEAPDLSILADERYADIGRHGAFYEVIAYWYDVIKGDYYNDWFSIKPGHRLIMRTLCPVINEPQMFNDSSCHFAWVIEKAKYGVYDSVTHEISYDGMLSVKVMKNGRRIGYIEKKKYNFLVECRSDHTDCLDSCSFTDRRKYMWLPAYAVDPYYLYTDITNITGNITVIPTINFKHIWQEQDYDNNSLRLPIRVMKSSPYVKFR